MITASVAGSAIAGGLVGLTGCKFYGGIGSPLGTFIGYIEQPIPFVTWILCTLAGILVTALIIGFWRKPVPENKMDDELQYETDKNIEVNITEVIDEKNFINRDVFDQTHIYVDENSKTQDEAYKFIAKIAKKHG